MLDKLVCMQCVNSFAPKWGGWTEHDDMRWGSEGLVSCPWRDASGYGVVNDPPPPGCHKALEQAVAAGMKNAQ